MDVKAQEYFKDLRFFAQLGPQARDLLWKLLTDVEESSPKRIFSRNHVFSVFVGLQNKYFNETMDSVYLFVHQNKYLTRFSVSFVVHQNVYILANNSFW